MSKDIEKHPNTSTQDLGDGFSIRPAGEEIKGFKFYSGDLVLGDARLVDSNPIRFGLDGRKYDFELELPGGLQILFSVIRKNSTGFRFLEIEGLDAKKFRNYLGEGDVRKGLELQTKSTVLVAAEEIDLATNIHMIDRKLSEGGEGWVYLTHNRNGDRFALKHVKDATGSLKKEYDMVNKVGKHDNVVEWKQCNKSYSLCSMELANQGSLKSVLSKAQTKFTPQQAHEMALGLFDGVSHIISKNILHGDLDARNIMVNFNTQTSKFILKVGDFGQAKNTNLTDAIFRAERNSDYGDLLDQGGNFFQITAPVRGLFKKVDNFSSQKSPFYKKFEEFRNQYIKARDQLSGWGDGTYNNLQAVEIIKKSADGNFFRTLKETPLI